MIKSDRMGIRAKKLKATTWQRQENKAKNKAIIIEIKATLYEDKLDELATSAIF